MNAVERAFDKDAPLDAGAEVIPPTHIWRGKIHTQELLDCGFDPRSPDQGWGTIKGIMKAKGFPDWCTEDRTPVKMNLVDDGILLEFQG